MVMMMLDVVALYTIFLLTYSRIRVTRFQQPGTRFLNRVISQLTSLDALHDRGYRFGNTMRALFKSQ